MRNVAVLLHGQVCYQSGGFVSNNNKNNLEHFRALEQMAY